MEEDADAQERAHRARVQLLRSRSGSGQWWVATSGLSMGQRFPAGSEILVEAADPPPRLGEVWLFGERDGSLVAHRCLGRTGDGFRFRGDALDRSDAPVAAEDLIGRATRLRSGTTSGQTAGQRLTRWPVLPVLIRIAWARRR